ncbi:MAG TPA: RNA methyltransferase [Myxococcota bacterium]|nr:RNA methyltransferase [Myxococcota bacterium]
MSLGPANLALIEGARPVIEALRAGRRRVHTVFVPEGDGSAAQRELEAVLAERAVERRPAKRGEKLHALADPFPEEEFEAVLTAPPPRFLVALDRVTDVGNLGSIARSAETAGAAGLVLEHRHAPPIAAGALRASAGALEHLRVGRTPNLAKALDLARAEGLAVLVADASGAPLDQLPASLFAGELVWVFGSEDLGARKSVRDRATATVGIPLLGRTRSLGVAAAAAYFLVRTAEIRRRGAGANLAGRAETS